MFSKIQVFSNGSKLLRMRLISCNLWLSNKSRILRLHQHRVDLLQRAIRIKSFKFKIVKCNDHGLSFQLYLRVVANAHTHLPEEASNYLVLNAVRKNIRGLLNCSLKGVACYGIWLAQEYTLVFVKKCKIAKVK